MWNMQLYLRLHSVKPTIQMTGSDVHIDTVTDIPIATAFGVKIHIGDFAEIMNMNFEAL